MILTQTKLPLLRYQPSAGSKMKPLTQNRGYCNVLLGQGYYRTHGAVINEYGVMGEKLKR
jgi:hypothetical protein